MGTIADLNELTLPAADDLLLVREVSDVLDKDKKMKIGTLTANLALKTNVYVVDKNFTNDATAKRYNTISAAMTAAAAFSLIVVGPGTYTETVTFSQHGIKIEGSGKPRYDGTNLVGGTLVVGQVNMNSKNGCEVKSLGVDVRTWAGAEKDAIIDNRGAPSDANNIYVDLSVLGVGFASGSGHGILLSGGGKNMVRGCSFYHFFHGLVFRCSGSIASDCYAFACGGNSAIIKSETPSGNANNNTITNWVLDGDPASGWTRGGPIRVTSAHASFTSNSNTISNITSRNAGESVVMIQRIAGSVLDTMISNVSARNSGDSAGRAEYHVLGAVVGVHFDNCSGTARSAGWGALVEAAASKVRFVNCNLDDTGAGAFSGTADWIDIGFGRAVQRASFGHLGLDAPTATGNRMKYGEILAGQGGINAAGVSENILTLEWKGSAGGYSALAVDLMVTLQSGDQARIFTRRFVCLRKGTTALTVSMDTIGTDMVVGAGGGSLTFATYIGAADTFVIYGTAVVSAVNYTYVATVITNTPNVWDVLNQAA